MLHLALVAVLVSSGTPAGKRAPPKKVTTIAAAWKALPDTGSACGEDLSFDYGTGGGMRNFFCRALTVFSWKSFLALAPVQPFRSGPHQNGKLNLSAKTQFGHYDPEFVRWAATALIPAATDATLRDQTQGVYDAQVRTLARVYFDVWRAISADPTWLSKERNAYGEAISNGNGDWSSSVVDLYHDTLGTAAQDWGGNDPNLVRSATMWWLRRTMDETAPQWADGLERLLTTYDGEWLKAAKAKRRPTAPKRPATPEYK